MVLKRKGFLAMQSLAIAILICTVIMSSLIYVGTRAINSVQTARIIEETDIIDNALQAYGSNHLGINTDGMLLDSTENKIRYKKVPVYPSNLQELGEMQGYGYFPMNIHLAGINDSKIKYENYNYSTNIDSNGIMHYKLTATLPDGSTYISKGSK